MFTSFDKALVPFVVAAILYGLTHFGFNADANFSTSLTAVVTALLVYFVPNK